MIGGCAMRSSSETEALFAILGKSATPAAAAAIEALARDGSDRDLSRVNALDFAAKRELDVEGAIAAFLHATRLGLFDMAWNVLCPGCGGVLDSSATLKSVRQEEYVCSLCARGYEPTLDESVEVTFTVSPNIRRIAAHEPHTLPMTEYYSQIFWGSGIELPDDATLERILDEITLDRLELSPGEKASVSLRAPEAFLIVFDPVVHMAKFIDVKGEPTQERQSLTLLLNKEHAPTGTVTIRPGPLRIQFENRSNVRTLPAVFIADERLHALMGKRRPFLTAKRLLTNQTFRDIYRTDALEVDQRLKITSLTFVFTDLKGSTELYDRVGDLVAYDLVKSHFRVLQEIVAAEAGAVVKTIGDAVMATFPTPDRAMTAALRMRKAMHELNAMRGSEDLMLKIGIHEGPCLAVTLNDRQDYFGQTVNVAARVQGLASSRAIFVTKAVAEDPRSMKILENSGLQPTMQRAALRGIADETT